MDALPKKDIFVGLVFTRITCVSTHVFISICLYTCVYYPKRTMQQTQRRLLYAVHPATHCNTLQHPATPCNTLQHPAHCNTLQRTSTPCNICSRQCILQHHATHCNTLQHPTTPCTLQPPATHFQHPATHYNTLQRTATQRISQRRLLYAVHPATPCNTLQHPTTQRIPPRHLPNVDLWRRPLFEKTPKKTGAPKKTFAAHPYTYAGYRHVWIFWK